MKKFFPSLTFLISFIIVAFGQPSRSLILSILASCIGYGLCFISLLEVRKRKNRFLLAGAWFALVQMVELGWLATPEYHGWYIIFIYLLLSLFLGLQFAFLSLFLSQYLKWDRILFLTSLWTLFEWGRLFIFCGFSWNPVGLALTAPLYASQMASLGGIFFLSFWVILANLLFLKGYLERRKKEFLMWGALTLFPYLFGFCHLSFHERKQQGKEMLHVALLQTGLRVEEKVFFEDRSASFVSPYIQWEKILGYLEQKERERPLDLIVLPEAALPFSANSPVYFYEEVMKIFVKKWGKNEGELDFLLKYPFALKRETPEGEKWFVTNAFWGQAIANHYKSELVMGLDDTEKEKALSFNAAFHFLPQGHTTSRYEKRILLPLAEYLPFPFLRSLVAAYGVHDFFTHGRDTKLFYGKVPESVSICYEETFSHLIREDRLKGAKLLINLTNDAWYPSSTLPVQHFYHGKVRALENGVPLVRACNSGVTAAVDSLGRVIGIFQGSKGRSQWEQGPLFVSLNLYSYTTLYSLVGNTPLLFLSLAFITFFLLCRKKTLASNRSTL